MHEEKIKIVKDRLLLTKKLIEVRNNFYGREYITINYEFNTWDHSLYRQYAALRYYLLLTCFDIFGQTKDYIEFKSWLSSSDHSEERNEIVRNSKTDETIKKIIEIHDEYNKIYGVSNSFKRFINEIISEKNREKLLKSISITKISLDGNIIKDYEPTENNKIKFLFSIRNSFTHNGIAISSPDGGIKHLFDEDEPRILPYSKTPLYPMVIIHKEKKNKFLYEYAVFRWPTLLIEIIEDTLNEIQSS
ncbi:MAG: hypothetical protein H6Q25_1197 [Bacteroidetes bacterium]|nr:hypothetical protein [Bacteroidota bacterium]